MNRIIGCLGALYLAACTAPHDKPGPLARGVRADAPRDTIGVMLSWTPDQTIVNFRRSDQIFTAHTIHRGANVRALPRAAVQIDPVVRQSDGLPTVSIEQLMDLKRITGVIAVKDGEIVLERYALGRGPDDRWLSMSVAKPVTSTLIGAAVKDGLIHSIDDPVVRYIP
jgi:CubicO group peptidase (beta-lactamase class C family)